MMKTSSVRTHRDHSSTRLLVPVWFIAYVTLLLSGCGRDDGASSSSESLTVLASSESSATTASVRAKLLEGNPASDLRAEPMWMRVREMAAGSNDALAILSTLEEAADLSPGSDERLAKYGENSFYRLYWQVIVAKLSFDAVHRSGNPIKIRAAEKAYLDRIDAIGQEWKGRTITCDLTVYHISEERLILGWSALPLRFMPPYEVQVVALAEDAWTEGKRETAVSQVKDLREWTDHVIPSGSNQEEDWQMMGWMTAVNRGLMMNRAQPAAQRFSHSVSGMLIGGGNFFGGYYDMLMSRPLSLFTSKNSVWMAPPAKLIAFVESARPSPVSAYCPVPALFPLERAAELDVGDTLEGTLTIGAVRSVEKNEEMQREAAWEQVSVLCTLTKVSGAK